jgi:hypothetical protein
MNVPKPSPRDFANRTAASHATVATDGTHRRVQFVQCTATPAEPEPSCPSPCTAQKRRPPANTADSDPPPTIAQGKEFAWKLGEIAFGMFAGLSRAERIQMAQVFRSTLVPRGKAGRRPVMRITRAYEAWKAGTRGVALYWAYIPNWNRLSRWRRQVEIRKLMAAIRSRRRRDSQSK